MDGIETHRRKLKAQGIDPDCMGAEYWRNYAAKSRAFRLARRQGKQPKKRDCPGCRINTEEE